jgi:hypothetical protein
MEVGVMHLPLAYIHQSALGWHEEFGIPIFLSRHRKFPVLKNLRRSHRQTVE